MNDKSQPMVSVVIPCLNRAHFLVPTIESVLNQSYPNIECIVVDGGSTDGTLEILKKYDARLHWISEPDNGHADAINKGWKISKGEILAWLNADDLWQVPDAISQAVDYLQKHPKTDVVYGDCGEIDEDGTHVGMSYVQDWDLEYAVLNCDHCIPQPSSFIRRSILEKVGWLDTNFYQKKDQDLWLRIGLIGKIEHLPALLGYARNQPGLSFDGRSAGPACVQVTRKFFSLPDIPEALKGKKKRAISNSYLRGMFYAWEGGRRWSIIFPFAVYAIFADPSNYSIILLRLTAYVKDGLRDEKFLIFPFILMQIIQSFWKILVIIKRLFSSTHQTSL